MTKPRGRSHTTLTETADAVIQELAKIPGVKMIAPGEIRANAKRRGGGRFATATYTNAGFELLISGQSVQRVSVHTSAEPASVFKVLCEAKRLKNISFAERERKPGV